MAKGEGKVSSDLRQQSVAVLVMIGLAISAVLGMIILNQFSIVVGSLSGLGNATGSGGTTNQTAQATITLFLAALVLFGSFASITALVILVKAVIGIVRNMN